MPQIPKELIDALAAVGTKRFIKVRPKSKKALEKGWDDPSNQYLPDDPSLVKHLENGGNVGLVGGRGLLLLDTDEPETEAIAQGLPLTTMIKSGGAGERYHRLYISDLDKTTPLKLGGVSEKIYGEIRCNGAYVVTVGSIHETTGNLYELYDARPLTFLSEKTIRETFKDYLKLEEKPQETLTKRIEPTPFDDLRLTDICVAYGTTLTGMGEELRGPRPGGTNPSSMTVNTTSNLWFSHPDQKGGGPAELIAVYEGIITISESEKGALRGEAFIKVLEAARRKGLIPDPNETFRQISENLPTKQKIEVTENTQGPKSYFVQLKNGPKLQYDKVIKEIITKYKIITFTDTEEAYVYDQTTGLYYENATPIIKKEIMTLLLTEFKKSYAEEIIYQIKILTYVDRDSMAPPENYFILKNGILDTETRELLPFTDNYFFLSKSDVDYDPSAKADRFLKFLEDTECAKIDTLQEFSGYLLLNSAKYKKALFISGPTDSGKSTFSKAVAAVIGQDNICSIPIQNLDGRFQEQRLYQKKLNMVGDLGTAAFKSVAMFKRTTGGDIIEAEVKGSNKTIKFPWTGKHWFDANDLPDTEGDADTDAFYNRLHMVTFSKQIPKDKINKNLPNELSIEQEKSGILNWMLEGLDRLEGQQDFSDKSSIDEIRTFYKRSSNTVYCFAEDRCTIVQGSAIQTGETFRLYAEYCIKENFSAIGKSTFYDQLIKNLPAISRDKVSFEDTARVHSFVNVEIEGANPSKMSKMSTHSPIPDAPHQHPPPPNGPSKNEKTPLEVIKIGGLAESGMVKCMDKMDKMDSDPSTKRIGKITSFPKKVNLPTGDLGGHVSMQTKREECLKYVRSGLDTSEKISAKMEISREGVEGLLKVLIRDGLVYCLRPGVWGVV